MKAVILVGGKATRLLPLTQNTPKAMVPVLNVPFLEHVVRHLSQHGVEDIILAQGHLAQNINDYFGDGSPFDVRLVYVVEDTPLGTAGAVKNAENHLDGTFLMLNGDIFTDLDLTSMIDMHRRKKAKATIATTPVEDPTAYGLIETGPDGRISRFLEKPKPHEITTNMINAGTYVLERDVLDRIPAGRQVSIEREVFPGMLERGEPVYACKSDAYWMDAGTPEKYLQLNRDILAGRCRSCVPPGQAIGENTYVDASVEIRPPVIVGRNCEIKTNVKMTGPVVIGDGCTLAEGSVIEDSVIWRKAHIGPRTKVRASVIADGCRLGEGCVCDGAVLGDNVTVADGVELKPGTRVSPGETLRQ